MRKLTPKFQSSYKLRDTQIECFGQTQDLPNTVAVAVSGGSDSMALLRLAHYYWGSCDKEIVALTVDHGLRPESADEAQQVARWCAELGIEHHTLNWTYDGKGNLSAAAREARYHLMAEFCTSRGIEHLYTAHTMDDQAETVLMRFARGAGVDGLAGMARSTELWGISVVRPFIGTATREDLRALLDEFEQTWIDDPTNDDPSYDRVKARELFEHLEPLGISVQSLSGLAHRMAIAKHVLEQEAASFIKNGLHLSPLGFATLNVDVLASISLETACRVIGQTASRIGGRGFRAHLRFEEQLVELALERSKIGGKTSGGCTFRPAGDFFHILREPARCEPRVPISTPGGTWDGRFDYEIVGELDGQDLQIGAVDEAGLAQIGKDYDGFSEIWQAAPREARLTTPGLWRGDVLLSAPLAPWVSDPTSPKLHIRTVWSKTC